MPTRGRLLQVTAAQAEVLLTAAQAPEAMADTIFVLDKWGPNNNRYVMIHVQLFNLLCLSPCQVNDGHTRIGDDAGASSAFANSARISAKSCDEMSA